MQAAMGCAQLERVKQIIEEKARVYKTYKRLLENEAGVVLQKYSENVDPVVWAIGITINKSSFPQGRDRLMEQLQSMGIETRPGFYSANTMPHLYGDLTLPVCADLSQRVLSFPSSPTLTDKEIEYICDSFRSCKK
jgi:perosamine synthetase